MSDLRQVHSPCPFDGSYYRRGNACNVCGGIYPDRPNIGTLPDGNSPVFSLYGHKPRGADWDAAQHKVIRRTSL